MQVDSQAPTEVTPETLAAEQSKLLGHAAFVMASYQIWIAAIPDDIASALPAMPGIDGDYAQTVMELAKAHSAGASLKEPVFGLEL